MSRTGEEKNRHAAWKETVEATPAPAGMPTTLRRPACKTSPVASTVNRVKVPRRRNTGRKGSGSESYTESELPTSFGPKTGTPEQGIDHTFILYAGPSRHP
jgi:hypothetical protein